MKNILKKLMIASLVLTLALPVGSWSGANAEAAEVTQTQPAKPVKLSKKVLKLKVGQKKKLVLKNAAGKVTWKSKNSSKSPGNLKTAAWQRSDEKVSSGRKKAERQPSSPDLAVKNTNAK